MATEGVRVYGDCDNVVSRARCGTGREEKELYGGIWRVIREKGSRAAAEVLRTNFHWTKAHQSLDTLEGDALHQAQGNDCADKTCRAALLQHPRWAKGEYADADELADKAVHIAKIIGRAGALWPRQAGKERLRRRPVADKGCQPRAQPRERPSLRQPHSSHAWHTWQGTKRCAQCLIAYSRTGAASCQPCPTQVPLFLQLGQRARDLGHRVWVAAVVPTSAREDGPLQAPVMCCAACGAWQQGTRKGRGRLTGLEKWCKERPSNSGAIAWRRFSAGEAPKYGPRWKGWVLRDVAPWPDGPDRIDDAADAV